MFISQSNPTVFQARKYVQSLPQVFASRDSSALCLTPHLEMQQHLSCSSQKLETELAFRFTLSHLN